jgi:hypothetical protein
LARSPLCQIGNVGKESRRFERLAITGALTARRARPKLWAKMKRLLSTFHSAFEAEFAFGCEGAADEEDFFDRGRSGAGDLSWISLRSRPTQQKGAPLLPAASSAAPDVDGLLCRPERGWNLEREQ